MWTDGVVGTPAAPAPGKPICGGKEAVDWMEGREEPAHKGVGPSSSKIAGSEAMRPTAGSRVFPEERRPLFPRSLQKLPDCHRMQK